MSSSIVPGTAPFASSADPNAVAPPPADSLPLTIVSNTATKLRVSWTPPAGCAGYHMFVDHVRVSTTGLAGLSATTFGKPQTPGPHSYEVRALGYIATGDLVL